MTIPELISLRLHNQQILASKCQTPEAVVTQLGALQAQDYPGALWSIGLRHPGAMMADIEKAIMEKKIVRTWPMRGTLHFVTAKDIRWMLALLTPRVIAGTASRQKNLNLNDTIFAQCKQIFTKALRGGKCLTRENLLATLEREKVSTGGQRGYHILWRLAQEGLICFGPAQGKKQTFVLLDEWLPPTKSLTRAAALAKLAEKYFTGHGPATMADFCWWSGLTVGDAKAGIMGARKTVSKETINDQDYWFSSTVKNVPKLSGAVYLLPGFDEYLLGYRDRSAVLDEEHAEKICPGFNDMFSPTIIVGGRVVGTWKKTIKKKAIVITPTFFGKVSASDKQAIGETAKQYEQFLGISE